MGIEQLQFYEISYLIPQYKISALMPSVIPFIGSIRMSSEMAMQICPIITIIAYVK